MPRTYASPEAFRMALEQRLRTQARDQGRDLSRQRQLVVFDRFLARVFEHLGERVIAKGGITLELRLERARTTKDVDLWMKGDAAKTLDTLRELGALAPRQRASPRAHRVSSQPRCSDQACASTRGRDDRAQLRRSRSSSRRDGCGVHHAVQPTHRAGSHPHHDVHRTDAATDPLRAARRAEGCWRGNLRTLLVDAVSASVEGVRAASLAAIARMKRAANRPKDREVLPAIEAALRERGEGDDT